MHAITADAEQAVELIIERMAAAKWDEVHHQARTLLQTYLDMCLSFKHIISTTYHAINVGMFSQSLFNCAFVTIARS
jgi:hypothetical protein